LYTVSELGKRDPPLPSLLNSFETLRLLAKTAALIDNTFCSVFTVATRVRAGLTVLETLPAGVYFHLLACDKCLTVRMFETGEHRYLIIDPVGTTPLDSS
jgi:hypothetical protein